MPCDRTVRRPPKAKVTRSNRANRVGCASFSVFLRAMCSHTLRLQFWFIRASKQSGENFYMRLNWHSQCRSVRSIERKLFGLGRVRGR